MTLTAKQTNAIVTAHLALSLGLAALSMVLHAA
ncbi:MAG: hypothetical protein JWM80_6233 [Cyanobacteria bacterium RYN_339]|nr:hypothetical protein [Cyanobacteria bacterium RYN_339]